MAHAKQDDWDTYTYMLTRGEKKILVQVEAILNPFSHTSLVPRLSVTESLGTRLLIHTLSSHQGSGRGGGTRSPSTSRLISSTKTLFSR